MIQIRQWSEDEFAASAAQWQELLGRSDADPLFMSWDWQWRWWHHHAHFLNAALCLFAAYDSDAKLVGLAPFYLRRSAYRYGIRTVRLEILGSTWRDGRGVFSEYLDFIVAKDHVDAALEAFAQVLSNDRRWSDMVIGNTRSDGLAVRLMDRSFSRLYYVRAMDRLEAYAAALPIRFDDYLHALNPSIRRKLWNHRKRLVDPNLTFADADNVGRLLDRIDDFHQHRWGCRHYLGARRNFHVDFTAAMARANALKMSQLTVAGEPISIMYNVRLGGTEYNLQSGFNPLKGLSPGYLHFGYCLERACDEGIHKFDFLAGQGRNGQYKQGFLTLEEEVVTLQIIRSRPLAWMYRVYDKFRDSRMATSLPLE